MDQQSFAEMEYSNKRRQTRRERFLGQMEKLIPWKRLESRIEPHYPNSGGPGRPPYSLSVMLRIHCMQLFYNLSDPAMEDALYEIESMRRFAGLKLNRRLPDETTILNFRHLLESHELGQSLFAEINDHLSSKGYGLREGTIIDATLIEAPASTKNREKQRDPEMHQTKKGNQWHFGMKLHIGTDDQTGLVHSAVATSANVHDITMADKLLHGDEERIYGDAGYIGIDKREEHEDREVAWNIAVRPGKRKAMEEGSDALIAEQAKASVRSKVEHPFRWVKGIFGYDKVRYRGLDKNMNRLCMLLGFSNLLRSRSLGYIG
jgi:IS5 family transposase